MELWERVIEGKSTQLWEPEKSVPVEDDGITRDEITEEENGPGENKEDENGQDENMQDATGENENAHDSNEEQENRQDDSRQEENE